MNEKQRMQILSGTGGFINEGEKKVDTKLEAIEIIDKYDYLKKLLNILSSIAILTINLIIT